MQHLIAIITRRRYDNVTESSHMRGKTFNKCVCVCVRDVLQKSTQLPTEASPQKLLLFFRAKQSLCNLQTSFDPQHNGTNETPP